MRLLDLLLLSAAALPSALAAPAKRDDVSSTTPTPTTTTATTTMERRKSKFQFVGVNQSGAEFGNKNLPGKQDKDWTWPVKSTIDVSR